MTWQVSPIEDDRLKGVSSGDYFLIACGKCRKVVMQLKYRRSTRGPVMDYKCHHCSNKGTLKLNGVVAPD